MSAAAEDTRMDDSDPGAAAALDAFHAAAARADVDGLLAVFADEGVFRGTDATERWQGDVFRAFVRERFAGGVGWTLSCVRRFVTTRGDVAWFDEELAHSKMGALRGSGALRRDGGVWRVALYDLSVPIPNERWAAVDAVLRGGDAAR